MTRCGRLIIALSIVAVALPAAASTWCGENGIVRLSFTAGDTLTSIKTQEPGQGGTTLVDLWAYLDGFEPVAVDGEAFMGIGGFELTLVIEGAEGKVVTKEFPFDHFDIASDPLSCIVGIDPSQRLENGRAQLVHYQVLFLKPIHDVTFTLDGSSLLSCATLPECPGSGIYALATGTVDARQNNDIFGLGCAPAYLNWSKPPTPEVLHSKAPYRDVGVMKPR